MPRSAGVYSLPSPENPVVTGAIISSADHNTTMSDIASELTASLPRDGSAGMSGPLLLPDGNSSAPGLSFTSEPSSGLYRSGSNDLRLQINAANVLQATATSVTIPIGLTVTQDTTNGSGVTGTGNGTGYGGDFNGGSSNGTAVRGTGIGTGAGATFTGGATGVGVTGTGGATSGSGVVGVGTAGNARGGEFTGNGSGNGVRGTGGASDGTGARGIGGATNGRGVWGTGTGSGTGVVGEGTTGIGVEGTGGGTAVGGQFANGTASIAATPQNALALTNGNLTLGGVANPNSNVGFSNVLTPKNIVKAWARFVTSGASSVTLGDGFNIASVAITGAGASVTVTFVTAMGDANYGVTTGVSIDGGSANPVALTVFSRAAGSVVFTGLKALAGAVSNINFNSDAAGFTIAVLGIQ